MITRVCWRGADGECCAQGNFKKEGHQEVCKVVGPKVKARKEL